MTRNLVNILLLIIYLLLCTCCNHDKSKKKNIDTNSGYISEIGCGSDTTKFNFDESGNLKQYTVRRKGFDVDFSSVKFKYKKHSVSTQGYIHTIEISQYFALDTANRAISCITQWFNDISNKEISISAFEYNAEGYLTCCKTKYYYNGRFIKERATLFYITDGNIVQIIDDTQGAQSDIKYGSDPNISSLRYETELWDSEIFTAAIYAGLLGKPSQQLPISITQSSRRDARTFIYYTLTNYTTDDFHYTTGFLVSSSFKDLQNTDNKTVTIKYAPVE